MSVSSRQLSSQQALDVEPATGSEDWHDLGSDSVAGCVSDFIVRSLVGGASPQVTPVLEMSPENGVGAPVHVLDSSFAAITVVDGAVFFQTAAACFRYIRWSWTTAGAPSAATADTHHEA